MAGCLGRGVAARPRRLCWDLDCKAVAYASMLVSMPAYDKIGIGYSDIRRPDPRIAAQIEAALGDAQTVLNVGAELAPTSQSIER